MSMSIIVLIGMLLLGAEAADALRCGSAVVSEGDYQDEVLQKCGEPAYVDTHVVYETFYVDPEGRYRVPLSPDALPPEHHQYPLGYLRKVTQPVYIEEWTYNFGSHRLKYYLRFVDGKLREIKTRGYGR